MNKHHIIGIAIAALFAGTVQAAPLAGASSVVEREASEGARGRDNERAGDRQRRGGKAIEDATDSVSNGLLISREGRASGGNRQRHGGEGRLIEDASMSGELLAREASEGPRGRDNERAGDRQRRGGKAIEDATDSVSNGLLISREGRASGGNRQRGGGEGRLIEDASMSGELLAREASEGPRGRDNERAGDRQRRGGRAG